VVETGTSDATVLYVDSTIYDMQSALTRAGGGLVAYIVAGEGRRSNGFVISVIGVAAQAAADYMILDLFLPIAQDRQRADCESVLIPLSDYELRAEHTNQGGSTCATRFLLLHGSQNKSQYSQRFPYPSV
jgi:hypothetical protein